MNLDDVEAQLRRAGPPENPPERLHRAVLNVPGGGRARPNVLRLGVAAALALAVLAGGGPLGAPQKPPLPSVPPPAPRGQGGGGGLGRVWSPERGEPPA